LGKGLVVSEAVAQVPTEAVMKGQTTNLVCYIHRKKFAEVLLNTNPYFPVAYDFCPNCEVWMVRNFERDMLGLSLLPRNFKTRLRLEKS